MENTKKVEEVGTESKAKKVEKPKKSTKKTTNETEVKQTEIKLDFVKLCQEKNAAAEPLAGTKKEVHQRLVLIRKLLIRHKFALQ